MTALPMHPSDGSAVGVSTTTDPRPSRHAARGSLPMKVCLALLAATVTGLVLLDADGSADRAWGVHTILALTTVTRWFLLPLVLACAVLHYVFASIALQASSGARLPMANRMLAQLSAATANRLTPAGIGGAALNARYLVRAGGLTASEAASSLAALASVGAVADMLLFSALVGCSLLADVPLPASQVGAVGSHALSLVWALTIVIAIVVLGVGLACAILVKVKSHSPPATRLLRLVADARTHSARLVRRPMTLLLLLSSSAATTLVMGVGLLSATYAVTSSPLVVSPVVIVIAYMAGSAAGSVLGVPPVFGLTEAGLIGALSVCGLPMAQAVQAVILFRVITFWLPAAAGLAALRALRLRGCL